MTRVYTSQCLDLDAYLLPPQAQGREKPPFAARLPSASCRDYHVNADLFCSDLKSQLSLPAWHAVFMERLFESNGLPVLADGLATAPACLASSPDKASVLDCAPFCLLTVCAGLHLFDCGLKSA